MRLTGKPPKVGRKFRLGWASKSDDVFDILDDDELDLVHYIGAVEWRTMCDWQAGAWHPTNDEVDCKLCLAAIAIISKAGLKGAGV